MKYFKNYQNFKLNEASDYGFNVFSLFKPFGNLISKVKYTIRLTNVANNYDAYLYDVYLEYLRRKRELPIPTNIGDAKIDVIGEDKMIHFDEEEINSNDTVSDEDDTVSDSEEETKTDTEKTNSTEEYTDYTEVDDDKEDKKEPLKLDAHKEEENYDKFKQLLTKPMYIDINSSDYIEFVEMLIDYIKVGNMIELNNMKQEYSLSFKENL